MKDIHNLLQKNREWADRIEKEDPDFFHQLAKQQSPEYLWIGCSDSRVPANQIIGMARARSSYTAMSPTWWCIPT